MLHACPSHCFWLDYTSDMLWRACMNVCGWNWRFAAIWKETDNKEKTSLLFSQVGGWGIKRHNSFRTPAYKHPNHGINFARRFLQYILLKSAYTVLRVTTQTALCIKEDGVSSSLLCRTLCKSETLEQPRNIFFLSFGMFEYRNNFFSPFYVLQLIAKNNSCFPPWLQTSCHLYKLSGLRFFC